MQATKNDGIQTGAVIDDTAFHSIRQVMQERFATVIVKYFESGAYYIEQIEIGIARNNPQLVMENAHPLKSSSAALGATRVAALATRIEHFAEKTPDISTLEPLVRQLKVAFKEASSELHAKLSF